MTVTLRPRTDADLDLLFAIAADLDTWEERSPGRPGALLRSAWEQRLVEQESDPANVRLVIEDDGVAVGSVSLFDVDDLARNAEMGIAIVAEARGRGIGTAAIALITTFAFERWNLHRLHLEVIASNTGAIRSYEKAGFVHEGRQREQAWVRGHYEDIVRMGLLRAEWRDADPISR
jgi:RimJ/RimL family protein N-acetyltransferase